MDYKVEIYRPSTFEVLHSLKIINGETDPVEHEKHLKILNSDETLFRRITTLYGEEE